MTLVIR